MSRMDMMSKRQWFMFVLLMFSSLAPVVTGIVFLSITLDSKWVFVISLPILLAVNLLYIGPVILAHVWRNYE